MVSGPEWIWYSNSGNHRATVAAALKLKKLPIQVEKVVDRSHASIWPNVRNGAFTQEGALKLFDRMFSGEPSAAAAVELKEYKKHVQQWLST